ncbi:transcription termination/antitermination protein NusG [Aeriscardovia aeriphila]|uniref:Transcription termination/antitermination protein NusG n=1 Tax=Aeriscardovia aeriphila TaxID=218139 RepID=A0A261FCT2_9BIFI|nr:transcription termination/antitermination protein NusG [Aeriscardovia aeriphila]NYI26148.1 transcriptional antiterminator NusG [Aeriscardovia aeriphila]OZG56696.1 transcription termination/antitermination factor NusG [Aeriscardovia aeriphila]
MVDENTASAEAEELEGNEPVAHDVAQSAVAQEAASASDASEVSDNAEAHEAEGAEVADGVQGAEAAGENADADNGEEEDAGTKAVAEFRQSLRTLPGKWYVLHTYSGYERRVKQNVEARVATFGLEDKVYQIEVPMEEVEKHTEKGKKLISRVRIPGYVLIRMSNEDEDAFRIVRETEAVTGFVGLQNEPMPLSRKEVVSMMGPMIAQEALRKAGQGEAAAKKRVVEVSFKQGDQVTVTDGPFATMAGVISEVQPQTQKVTVLVSIFDRDTPVELNFSQVKKVDDEKRG